jgi:endonuclease YncB( thermonuclease family)
MRALLTIALLIGLLWPVNALADITGKPRVIDGDTLEIAGERIRLHGIDAPEAGQTCRADGIEYRCGQQAALALADKIGQQAVSCQPKDQDRYGRIIAVCWLGAEDLGAWMVSEGWALAYRKYSTDYVLHEGAARQDRRGLWRGEFQAPWEWRSARRNQ